MRDLERKYVQIDAAPAHQGHIAYVDSDRGSVVNVTCICGEQFDLETRQVSVGSNKLQWARYREFHREFRKQKLSPGDIVTFEHVASGYGGQRHYAWVTEVFNNTANLICECGGRYVKRHVELHRLEDQEVGRRIYEKQKASYDERTDTSHDIQAGDIVMFDHNNWADTGKGWCGRNKLAYVRHTFGVHEVDLDCECGARVICPPEEIHRNIPHDYVRLNFWERYYVQNGRSHPNDERKETERKKWLETSMKSVSPLDEARSNLDAKIRDMTQSRQVNHHQEDINMNNQFRQYNKAKLLETLAERDKDHTENLKRHVDKARDALETEDDHELTHLDLIKAEELIGKALLHSKERDELRRNIEELEHLDGDTVDLSSEGYRSLTLKVNDISGLPKIRG